MASSTNVLFASHIFDANAFNYFFCNIGHNLGKNFDDKLPDVEQLVVLLKYQKCL
jgi:hypothetical protein